MYGRHKTLTHNIWCFSADFVLWHVRERANFHEGEHDPLARGENLALGRASRRRLTKMKKEYVAPKLEKLGKMADISLKVKVGSLGKK